MMMNSINNKSTMVIVLTALVCLWITPTFSQSIAIQQEPSPVAVDQKKPVNLTVTVTGADITAIQACNWYKGFNIIGTDPIAVYIRSTNKKSAKGSATVNEDCTLHFDEVTQSDIANYILFAQFNETTKTANRVMNGIMNGANRFEISSIVLLAAAGLISSFTLF